MANKKTSSTEETLNSVETNVPKTTKPTKPTKIKYIVEFVGKNRVWLRKDQHTVVMLTLNAFDYQVGDIVEL